MILLTYYVKNSTSLFGCITFNADYHVKIQDVQPFKFSFTIVIMYAFVKLIILQQINIHTISVG